MTLKHIPREVKTPHIINGTSAYTPMIDFLSIPLTRSHSAALTARISTHSCGITRNGKEGLWGGAALDSESLTNNVRVRVADSQLRVVSHEGLEVTRVRVNAVLCCAVCIPCLGPFRVSVSFVFFSVSMSLTFPCRTTRYDVGNCRNVMNVVQISCLRYNEIIRVVAANRSGRPRGRVGCEGRA